MLSQADARAKLEEAIPASDDVYVNANVDEPSYLASLAADLRSHTCEPFLVTARVMEPGFPWLAVGERISGYCIARNKGYWLVYQPAEERFLCFWGTSTEHLGAHGVFGSPLYCWSA